MNPITGFQLASWTIGLWDYWLVGIEAGAGPIVISIFYYRSMVEAKKSRITDIADLKWAVYWCIALDNIQIQNNRSQHKTF